MRSLIIITLVATILTACSGKESRIEKYYQSGEAHYSNSNCIKAKLEYKNALQIDPNYAPAYVGLGKCLLDQKIWISAYAHFSKALLLDENNTEARIYSAKLLTLSQEFSEARQFIQDVLTIEPKNSAAVALRGFIEMRTGNDDLALSDADLAITYDNQNLEAITLKSLLLIRANNYEEVAIQLDHVLASEDIGLRKSKELRLILASVYQQIDSHDDTVRIYQSLVDDFPDEIPYLNALARQYANDSQLDAARQIYTNRLEDDYHPDIILEFVSFLNNYAGRDEAFSLLKEYAQQEKITGKVRLALAREYLFLGDRDSALLLLSKLANNKNIAEQMEAINEIAFLHIKDGDNEKALELVDEILTEQPNNIRALITRGKISTSIKNYSQAIADFRVVIRLMPSNIQAIRELTKTYVLDQQPDLAKTLIINSYENNGSDKDLAEIYVGLASSETEILQSIELMSAIYQNDTKDMSSFSTLFNLYLTNKDIAKARQLLDKIDARLITSSFAYYHSAMLNLADNNYPQAVVDLKKTISAEQRSDTALKTLIDIHLSNDDKAEAVNYLQTTIRSDQEYILPYILLADILVADKDFKTARTYLEQALEFDIQSVALYQRLATLVALDSSVDEGMEIIKKGLEVTDEPEILGVDLALSQYRLGRRGLAIATLTDALRRVPDSIMIKTQLAYMLADEQSDDLQIARALALIEQVEDSELVQVQGAVGWIKYKVGNYNQAIAAYKRALKQSPNNAELNYQLGIALMDSGSNAEAEIFLARASNADEDFAGKQDAVTRLQQLRTM